MKNVIKIFLILCVIFELSTNVYDWLMTSFCLQKYEKLYKVDHVSKGK